MATTINPLAGAEHFPAVLTKRQAADYLQASTRFLEREIRAGRLKACKPSGKFVRIYRRDLDAFLQSGSSIGGGE
jgi:excisionase family DNA binding protein